MGHSIRDLQLASLSGAGASAGDDSDELEDVRLLDSYDADDVSNSKIEEGMKRIQVRVTGMTCAACSNSVESALNSLHGVLTASVALLQNKADVVFNPTLLKVPLLTVFSKKQCKHRVQIFETVNKIKTVCHSCNY